MSIGAEFRPGKVVEKEPAKQEIEVKYTVDLAKIPAEVLADAKSAEINQGYISMTDEREERVRSKYTSGKFEYTHTIKTEVKQGDGLVRNEEEKKITEAEFTPLWEQTEGKRVEKVRSEIAYIYTDSRTGEQKEVTVELDRYSGNLTGLVVAEVEFGSENDVAGFVKPEWFRTDVTQDKQFKNKKLAVMPSEKAQGLLTV